MSNKKNSGLTRRASGLMALEPRFMFDGAAVDSATDTLTSTTPVDVASSLSAGVFKLDASAVALASTAQAAQEQARNYLATATDAQLFSLFNGGKTQPDASWVERLSELREALSNGSFHVNIVAMDRASQFTAVAAFTEHGPNGEPTIFINTFWFGMFDAPDATRALVEELGHAFDAYLNPNADSGGDEGEAFADTVVDGALSAEQSVTLLTQNDQGTVTVNGVTYDVEFASLNFKNAYEMVYDQDNDTASISITAAAVDVTERWADKEQNSHYFNASVSLGVTRMTDGTGDQSFSGNDVSGAVSVTLGGTTYYGWISRPIKSNGIVRGFYFWTDTDFTTLALAQADGNQDRGVSDPGSLDNRGFLLVVDQDWFNEQITSTGISKSISNNKDGNDGAITVANVGSSSDRVDAALNSVMPPNSAPAAANDSLTVNEDSGTTTVSASSGLLSNDTDVNNDTLTITGYTISGVSGTQTLGSAVTITGVGSITINSNGSYSFTPVANYSGSVPPITYTVSDGNGGTATAVLSITVTPVNDAPDAINDTATITEDTPASGNLLGNDTDPDGDPLTVTSFSIAGQSGTFTLGTPYVISGVGTLTVNANGTYSFVPASNYTGAVPVVTYTISDGHGGTDTATLSMTMAPSANEAPVANPDNADGALSAQAPGCASGTAVTETQQTGNVLTNDTDPDITLVAGTTHQVTAVTSGTGNTWNGTTITGKYGVLTIGANGAYSYNIDENNADVKALASGATLSETFSYTVSEIGNSPNLTSSSTLRIVINGVNNAPIAVNDYDTLIEGAASGSPTTYGTTSGNVTTNDQDFDSASFSISNIAGPSTTTFTTTGWPSSLNSKIASDFDTVQVSANGTSFTTLYSGSSKVLVSSLTASGQNISVVFTDGQPLLDFKEANPSATITIRLLDGGSSYSGTYGSQITTSGTSTSVTSSVTGTVTGEYGSLNIASDGSYTYTLTSNALTAGQTYQERFTYTVTDSNGCSSTATLYIVVNGTTTLVMDDESVTTAEDTTLTVADGATNDLLIGDSGFSGTPEVTAFVWGGTQGTIGSALTKDGLGTLTINANGSYTFVPASNYSGPVPDVLYTASDGSISGQAVLKISITPANDASVLAVDTKTIPEDGSGSGNVLDNDTDTDNSLSVASYTWNNGSGTSTGTIGTATDIISGGVTVGTLTLGSNGFYTFTPAANWNGTVPTISYTTNTGSTSKLDITVTPINDPPTLDLDASGSGTGWNTSYTNQGSAVSIGDTDVAIADVDDTNIETATIILTNAQTGDALNFDASALLSSYGITATSSTSGGVITITLTGAATLANYQNAIKAITFSSTGSSTIDRVISVKVNDGSADSNTAYTTIDVNPDARTLTVTGTTVNEASPYVQFQVGGASEQWVSLAIGTTGSGSGHATMGTDFLPNLQYFNGTSWVDYTGGFVQIPSGATTLLVRTPVLQDGPYEGAETLKLTAYNQSQWSLSTGTSGNSTIVDDGTGSIYLGNNNSSTPNAANDTDPNGPDYPAYLDDDRPVTVNSIVVNEASPYAVLTISGYNGQVLNLAWRDLTAKKDADSSGAADGTDDYGPSLQYWDPAAGTSGDWVSYNGTSVTMSGSTLYVRTNVINDTPFEGLETFSLEVTKASSGAKVYGTVGIVDDGTGTKYPNDNPTDGVATDTSALNDDRTITVTGGLTFNEGSPYATFTVSGVAGAEINLILGNTSSNSDVDATIAGFTTSYSEDGGVTWIDYTWNGTTGNRPTVPANGSGTSVYGTVLVRVNIASEEEGGSDLYEGPETFTLTANYATNNAITSTGADTIVDDGTGRIDRNGDGDTGDTNEGTGGPGTGYEDDRVTSDTRTLDVVGGITFNEASTYATFTVTGDVGSVVNLELGNTTSSSDIDATISGFTVQYNTGSGWVTYTWNGTTGNRPTVPAGGTFSVRVNISSEADSPYEGAETFTLKASYATNANISDTDTDNIIDDGTGKMDSDGDGGSDEGGTKDDDRPKSAAPLPPSPPPPGPPALPPAELAPSPPKAAPTQGFSSTLTPLAPALVPTDPPLAMLDAVTSGSGFQIPVSESAAPGLNLYQGITDQFVQTTDAMTKVSLPFDAFIHSNKDAVIKLDAKQADGSKLPAWVQFDPASGVFEVTPPKGFKGKLDLKVVARDDDGREAVAIFQMFVGEQSTTRPQSRDSFTEKLRMAGKRPMTLVRVSDLSHKVTARDTLRARAG